MKLITRVGGFANTGRQIARSLKERKFLRALKIGANKAPVLRTQENSSTPQLFGSREVEQLARSYN